jgi:hypothetical protein
VLSNGMVPMACCCCIAWQVMPSGVTNRSTVGAWLIGMGCCELQGRSLCSGSMYLLLNENQLSGRDAPHCFAEMLLDDSNSGLAD